MYYYCSRRNVDIFVNNKMNGLKLTSLCWADGLNADDRAANADAL